MGFWRTIFADDCLGLVFQRPGPTGNARHANNELDFFLLFMADEMIELIVDCTDKQMFHVRNLSGRNRDSVDDTDIVEIKCLFGLFLFCGIYHNVHMPCEYLWYREMSSRKIYEACMSYKRLVWLMRCLTFDNRDNIRSNILNDRLARMRWLVTQFEKNARKSYHHSELVCIDEIFMAGTNVILKCIFQINLENMVYFFERLQIAKIDTFLVLNLTLLQLLIKRERKKNQFTNLFWNFAFIWYWSKCYWRQVVFGYSYNRETIRKRLDICWDSEYEKERNSKLFNPISYGL